MRFPSGKVSRTPAGARGESHGGVKSQGVRAAGAAIGTLRRLESRPLVSGETSLPCGQSAQATRRKDDGHMTAKWLQQSNLRAIKTETS